MYLKDRAYLACLILAYLSQRQCFLFVTASVMCIMELALLSTHLLLRCAILDIYGGGYPSLRFLAQTPSVSVNGLNYSFNLDGSPDGLCYTEWLMLRVREVINTDAPISQTRGCLVIDTKRNGAQKQCFGHRTKLNILDRQASDTT